MQIVADEFIPGGVEIPAVAPREIIPSQTMIGLCRDRSGYLPPGVGSVLQERFVAERDSLGTTLYWILKL